MSWFIQYMLCRVLVLLLSIIMRITRKIRNLTSAEPCATSKYEVVVVGYLIYYIISIISATSKYEVVGYLICYLLLLVLVREMYGTSIIISIPLLD